MTEATMVDLESRTGSAPEGNVAEEAPGVYVAILREPVAPNDLAALAGSLPEDVVMTDAERDGDSVHTTLERGQVVAFDWDAIKNQ
ncbi:hypothetical protein O7632_14110 [Solwaraspora sp. WMMD406]|uniref:hypothetical protein n=1 Tax=Solwaraspora sp. WMMD406 TaxID=3016095 RepID=UPI002417EF8E|nr:hypothetical protein [Solwaraspora sp. WMMD406]MDG4765220.1 hypothetical protein [Solwaraspora sp. WMMD406]